jgi:hypothetical protein
MVALLVLSVIAGSYLTGHSDGQLAGDANLVGRWSSRAHDLVGTVLLVAGAFALVTRKGGRLHRKAGWAYATSMIVLAVSVLPMLIIRPSAIQLELTVLATYLALSALAIVRDRTQNPVTLGELYVAEVNRRQGVVSRERLIAIAMAMSLAGFSLAALLPQGTLSWSTSYADTPANVLSLLGLCLAVHDLLFACLLGSQSGKRRIESHVLRMVGSLLVILSAGFFNICAATNLLPQTARWLIPLVGSVISLPVVSLLFLRAFNKPASADSESTP